MTTEQIAKRDASNRAWRLAHPEYMREYGRAYQDSPMHKLKIATLRKDPAYLKAASDYAKVWRRLNPEVGRAWVAKNPEYQRRYYEAHKEYFKNYRRRYYEAHRAYFENYRLETARKLRAEKGISAEPVRRPPAQPAALQEQHSSGTSWKDRWPRNASGSRGGVDSSSDK